MIDGKVKIYTPYLMEVEFPDKTEVLIKIYKPVFKHPSQLGKFNDIVL